MSPAGARRVCVCRPRYDLSNDMLLEAFRRYLEEMEYIQSSVEDGVSPVKSEIWPCTVTLIDVGVFFIFPI